MKIWKAPEAVEVDRMTPGIVWSVPDQGTAMVARIPARESLTGYIRPELSCHRPRYLARVAFDTFEASLIFDGLPQAQTWIARALIRIGVGLDGPLDMEMTEVVGIRLL